MRLHPALPADHDDYHGRAARAVCRWRWARVPVPNCTGRWGSRLWAGFVSQMLTLSLRRWFTFISTGCVYSCGVAWRTLSDRIARHPPPESGSLAGSRSGSGWRAAAVNIDKLFIPNDAVDYTSTLVQPRRRNPASQQSGERAFGCARDGLSRMIGVRQKFDDRTA